MILAILGPGTLGCSLARHAVSRGLTVRLLGRDGAHAQSALEGLQRRNPTISGVSALGLGPEALEGADFLLEALPEDPEIKERAWKALRPWLPELTLRLTGSSSLPIKALDESAGLQGRLMGFHLFVPVSRMGAVECVVPNEVPDQDRQGLLALSALLGLKAIQVKDGLGYAAARMGLAQGLEAMRLLEAGVASAADLDALMVLGYGHPVGPLELSDRIGLDLRLAIATRLFQATLDPRFEPPAILVNLVAKGDLGRKTGRGFFAWDRLGACPRNPPGGVEAPGEPG